tara:strand:- start:57 stop:962 length:906 start_codon:yes stop_codon:yes gene_type:complete
VDIPNKETLERLVSEGLTIKEIGMKYAKSQRTAQRWLKIRGIAVRDIQLKKYPIKLTEFQKQMLTGNMLGDGHIKKEGRFSFKQKIANEEYVAHINKILNPFSRSIFQDSGTKMFFTINHPIFKDMRKIWYKNNTKIVPQDIKISDIALAYWFMDDGTNVTQDNYKYLKLYTNGFSNEEIYRLIKTLKNQFQLDATKHSDNSIYINCNGYFRFIDIVRKHIKLDCFKYKVDTSNALKNRKLVLISDKLKSEINKRYSSGKYTQKELGNLYGISQSFVCKIVNSSYGPKVTGEADVKVGYNY